ncbi:MAG: coproporphyrinogen III oxidase family protein, partial [Anaerolineae bacterium]|nr:coproporphyrinogen III oxidase family protein [Anaerolineae bacterium]
VDLIFGLPGQSVSSWAATLEHILELAPQHLSLYSLTLEEETPLARAIDAGELPEPDPDRAADMYELASEYLLKAGFWQYEVSNWARGTGDAAEVWALPPSGASEGISPWICTHNLNYWRNRPWLGIGAGAYSWLDGHRWNNYSHPRDYVAVVQAGRHPVDEVESIWPALERGETLMMGLRLAEGVEDNRFRCRFGMGMVALYGSIIADMVELGLLIWDGKRARLSTKGRLLGNRVFGAFLPE